MTTIEATELKVGDVFKQRASGKEYEVVAVEAAHRDEYAALLQVRSLSTGNLATVAFQSNVKVIVK